MNLIRLAVAILIAVLGTSGQAVAVTQNRTAKQTAVTNCQAALPSFEGAFRKRPLGIVNEGDTTPFISCGFTTDSVGSTRPRLVVISFTNTGAINVDVPCTLVSGPGPAFGLTAFFPKRFTLGPGSTFRGWSSAAENNGVLFLEPSISCAIPPGVEINATSIEYEVEAGP